MGSELSELAEVPLRSRFVGFMCIFGCPKSAESNIASGHVNSALPIASCGVPVRAFKAARATRTGILLVGAWRRQAQIFYSVVNADHVLVIDLSGPGIIAGYEAPNQSMLKIGDIPNRNFSVFRFLGKRSGACSRKPVVPKWKPAGFPKEKARQRVIIEHLG